MAAEVWSSAFLHNGLIWISDWLQTSLIWPHHWTIWMNTLWFTVWFYCWKSHIVNRFWNVRDIRNVVDFCYKVHLNATNRRTLYDYAKHANRTNKCLYDPQAHFEYLFCVFFFLCTVTLTVYRKHFHWPVVRGSSCIPTWRTFYCTVSWKIWRRFSFISQVE